MAQEIARRIVPVTSFLEGETVRGHIERHIDPETREFLFPDGEIPEELEQRLRDFRRRQRRQRTPADIRGHSRAREALASRPDVAALRQAYREAVFVNTLDTLDDRRIGEILLHAFDAEGAGASRSSAGPSGSLPASR
jgi:hypothetical protein